MIAQPTRVKPRCRLIIRAAIEALDHIHDEVDGSFPVLMNNISMSCSVEQDDLAVFDLNRVHFEVYRRPLPLNTLEW